MNSVNPHHLRVIITGGTPDALNRNVPMRSHVAEGFSEILGKDYVVNLPLEIAPSRIRSWSPRLVVIFGSCLPDSCDYSDVRSACDQRGTILVFWTHDDPYEFDSMAKIHRIADHIFSNDRWASMHYHRDNVWHLPMAASCTALSQAGEVAEEAKKRDVFFCGIGFQNRRRILKDLSGVLRKVRTEIYGDEWNTDELPFCRNERIPNERMKDYYASSRIVLNMGRDFQYANKKYDLVPSTPGPRTFEAAMAGACQMIFADSLEVMDYFDIHSEIVLFDDPIDFEAKLMDLLDHWEKRFSIGAAARARCLKEHTYAARASVILDRTGIVRSLP